MVAEDGDHGVRIGRDDPVDRSKRPLPDVRRLLQVAIDGLRAIDTPEVRGLAVERSQSLRPRTAVRPEDERAVRRRDVSEREPRLAAPGRLVLEGCEGRLDPPRCCADGRSGASVVKSGLRFVDLSSEISSSASWGGAIQWSAVWMSTGANPDEIAVVS